VISWCSRILNYNTTPYEIDTELVGLITSLFASMGPIVYNIFVLVVPRIIFSLPFVSVSVAAGE
jgi:hypothetical protein